MALTGRFTFQKTWTGKILLQVEEEVKSLLPFSRSNFKRRWRNATLMDLAAPELRALMDLRYKPQFMAQYQHLVPDAPAPEAPAPQPAPVAGSFDGIAVPAGQLLGSKSAQPSPRPKGHDVTVEVQSYHGVLSGRA